VLLLALDGDDACLELGRQLIGEPDRPARAVGERFEAVLLVAVEDLVSSLREMPKSRQTSVIDSPSKRRATKRRRSSITELSFHGIHTLRKKAESVTHVSGTNCHLCLGPLTGVSASFHEVPLGSSNLTQFNYQFSVAHFHSSTW
jgi:hypothetical protein